MIEDSEKWARRAIASAGMGVWAWDAAADLITWAPAPAGLFGADADAPRTFAAYRELVIPEDRAALEALRDHVVGGASLGEESSFVFEHRIAAADGSVRWIEVRGRPFVGREDGAVYTLGTLWDATRSKQTETALRESEATLRLFADLASDYVYVVHMHTESLAPSIVAGSFERTTGYTPEEVAAAGGWENVIHPADRASARRVFAALARGLPQVAQYRIITGRGEVRWLRDRIRPVLDPQTGAVVSIRGAVQDITEQRALEEQLMAARRDEALARFAGDVAHDFNNLLTVIGAALSIAEHDVTSPRTPEMFEAIRQATERAAELTRGMLLFGRRVSGEPRTLPAAQLVERGLAVLRQGLGRLSTLEVDIRAADALVTIDPGQAQLLLLNLVVNARHATPDGGEVRITVDVATFQDGDLHQPAELAPGEYVFFRVQDDGVGIEPDVISKIFEPFFTTRAPGEGSGMGLAACRGIALRAGGTITARSVPGEGATFTVYLPRQTSAEAAADEEESAMSVSVGGAETLLVVDDDPVLRRIIGMALVDRGYDVASAESAEEALELLAQRDFDLVLSDIVMPGMDGVSLANRLRDESPDRPVLLMSGNVDGADAGFPFVLKPISPDGLARRIRALLDARQKT